ncbi:MAG: hypothetical protein U9Q40_11105, partial [Campylobacterota bacterium]|nr:hypothetical protein [Campylobacterota bacterium]
DLPIIDTINLDGSLFLVSFDVILIFYLLIVESFKKNEYKKLEKSLYVLVFIVILISLLPLFSVNITFTIFLYALFFSITLFKISKYYYKTKYEIPFFEHNNYKGGYGGMIDDPFTVEDDINRAKFSIEGVYGIFSFIFFFYEQVARSIAFIYIIRDKRNVSESARLFVYLLNSNVDIQKINSSFTPSSKIILETIGYVIFENNVTLCEEARRKFKVE